MDIPFLNYHASVLIDKFRSGKPIYASDVDKFIYGSSLYKLASPYFRSNPSKDLVYAPPSYYQRRSNFYLGQVRYRGNVYPSTYKARSGRYSFKQGRGRSVSYKFGKRRYSRRSLWSRSVRGQRRFGSRYSY